MYIIEANTPTPAKKPTTYSRGGDLTVVKFDLDRAIPDGPSTRDALESSHGEIHADIAFPSDPTY